MTDPIAASRGAYLYLDLLKRCLTRLLFPDRSVQYPVMVTAPFSARDRIKGRDWPTEAETMVGLFRLDSLQACVVNALEAQTQGDLVEAGVWRGGASIMMRAILKAFGDGHRRVWLADSFQGLPHPDPLRYPSDCGDRHHQMSEYLGVTVEQVKSNFRRYELLDDQVSFLPGWFRDSLPDAPIQQIAVLRLDCDMYESTTQVLENLYRKVSDGGFVVVDDYGGLSNCRKAVDDFREAHRIAEPLFRIDWTGVFWQKGRFGISPPPGTINPQALEENEPEGEFNEELYLTLYRDVAEAVAQGIYASGKDHFDRYGKAEGRRSY